MIIIYTPLVWKRLSRENNLWPGKEKLNFAEAFQGPSPSTDARLKAGRQLLEDLTKNGNFSVFEMLSILRDDQAGICVDDQKRGVRTTSSQVSVLKSSQSKTKSPFNACHFLTGTPYPKQSLFKPFIFSDKAQLGPLTVSSPTEIAAQRTHPLYAAHQAAHWATVDYKRLHDFEHDGIREILDKLKETDTHSENETYENLFHEAVAAEIEFLRDHPSNKWTWTVDSAAIQ